MNTCRLIKVSLFIASAVFGLTGCQINGKVIGISDYCYDDSDKYVVGKADLTDKVDNINIDWLVGNVKVMSHNLNTLAINNLEVNSLSSNVNLSNCSITQSLKFNTLSGELDAELSNSLNEFKGNSTSGSFTISAPSISRFDVSTISGEVNLSLQKEPDWLDIDSTSGNIKLALPESASFTLNYDTTSGNLSSDLDYNKSKGKYIFGDGKNEYKIETVSGNVKIKINI